MIVKDSGQRVSKNEALAKVLDALVLSFEAKQDLNENDSWKSSCVRQMRLARSLREVLSNAAQYGIEVDLITGANHYLVMKWRSPRKGYEAIAEIIVEQCSVNFNLKSEKKITKDIPLERFYCGGGDLVEVVLNEGCRSQYGSYSVLPEMRFFMKNSSFSISIGV